MAIFAWASLIFVAAVTLSPIEFRPVLTLPLYEHFFAFAVIGLLFGLAYPRHWLLIALAVIGSAVALELLQLLTPGRHGRVPDVIEKILGGIVGLVIARVITAKRQRR
jgi:VanZ family protein